DAPVDSERGPLSWFPLEVLDRELNVRLGGYWARRGDLLLTFVSSPATSAPLEMGSALSDRGDRGDLRASKRGAF
ncbi:MAG: hypothetical protein KAI47_05740, partial [Deltaproteobacteria bacterium]|nr:hypothetical protein [Deltaproteobacteria bacterium]